MIGADVKTFVVLEDGYAKDRNYVYNGQRLDKVDVRSFESIGNGFYRDKNNVRWGGVLQLKRLNPSAKAQSFDPYSFEILPCGFARDKTGVYAHGGGGTVPRSITSTTNTIPELMCSTGLTSLMH